MVASSPEGHRAAAAVVLLAVVASLSLQGCEISRHHVGNWQGKTSYLTNYEYIPPGAQAPQLNSCSTPDAALAVKCSGRGVCEQWFPTDLGSLGGLNGTGTGLKPLSFCRCDRYWADPECRTERRSQYVAFFLSLFFGVFGADQLYLGFQVLAVLKLVSFGGGGVWYVYDVMRIGSSEVFSADRFQVADDLSHFVFVLSVIGFALFLGFAISIRNIGKHRMSKARELMILQAQSPSLESGQPGPGLYASRPTSYVSAAPVQVAQPRVSFTGYGSTLGPALPVSRSYVT